MRGNYIKPSELLAKQKATGMSYWDMVGRPLQKVNYPGRREKEIDALIERLNQTLEMPQYKGGKSARKSTYKPPQTSEEYWRSLNATQRKNMQNFVNYFRNAGFNDIDIAGLMGNAAVESQFDPNALSPDGAFGGLFQNSHTIRNYIKKVYGDLSAESQMQFVVDMMNRNDKKLSKEWIAYGSGFKKGTYATPQQSSTAFRQAYERPSKKSYALRDHFAGLMPELLETYFPAQQPEPKPSAVQQVVQNSPNLFPGVSPQQVDRAVQTYYPQIRPSIAQPMLRDAADKFVDYQEQPRGGRQFSPLDLWQSVNDEQIAPEYSRGKSYQFPFWNRMWNSIGIRR